MKQHYDTIIVGGGLAGIAAAQRLTTANQRVALVEARPRFGGRVWTHHEPGVASPIELGPEWFDTRGQIHHLLAEMPGGTRKSKGEFLRRVRGELLSIDEPEDGWLDLQRRLNAVEGADRSLGSALAECCDDPRFEDSAETLRQYVSGFHAADPDQLSLAWLRTVEKNQSAGDSEMRSHWGLDGAVNALLGGIGSSCTAYLDTTVKEVCWRKKHVELDCVSNGMGGTLTASAAIITLPLSILCLPPEARGAVSFSPPLAAKESAFRLLATGHVLKLNFIFDAPFWRDIPRMEDALFLQDPTQPFPTWWTSLPDQSPVMVGWAAGTTMRPLESLDPKALQRTAIRSLAHALRVPPATVSTRVKKVFWHDWQRDPLAQGAYSWVRVGGQDAHRELAAPLSRSLYFAGEATRGDGLNATMDGAIQSGFRAAEQVLDGVE